MEKIFVVGPFSPPMRAALESAIPSTNFAIEYITSYDDYPKLENADYVIIRTLELKGTAINFLTKAKLIQRWGAGYDSVDVEAAGQKGIQVAITYGMNAIPVSEMAVALALAVYRNIVPMTNEVKKGGWSREAYAKKSYTLNGKNIGLYGLGNVGKKTAALFKAFGCNVYYYDVFRQPEDVERALGVQYLSNPEELWPIADIISLHAPLTDSTKAIICAKTLECFKTGSILINTAREELVVATDLLQAIKNGKILGAGLDAIESSQEYANLFSGVEQVIFTEHLGGNTIDNATHMAQRCAEQIIDVSRGKTLAAPHLVNGTYLQNKGI